MNNKFFKFHFKNDDFTKAMSLHVELNTFSEAMQFGYEKLDQLNDETPGYRIVGIYEILTRPKNYDFRRQTN
jgi:hypothetical protein|tara:strand:- start:4064 stop:4279 length:216 start_codon:yes stop_codon:yes gene_type:complete